MSIPERTLFDEQNGRINPSAGDGTAFEVADRDRISITFDADGGDYSLAISNDGTSWIIVTDKLVGTHIIVAAADGFEASTGNMVTAPATLRCIPAPCAFIRFVTVTPGGAPSAVALSTRF